MIKFNDIPSLIKKLNTTKLAIHDSNDNVIFNIKDADTVEQTIRELKELESILKTYGRVFIYAADLNIDKGRWKNAYRWEVAFSDATNTGLSGVSAVAPTATAREHALDLKLKEMEWEIKTEKRFREMEEKLKKKEKKEFDPAMIVPIIGDALGMDENKIMKYMKLIKGDYTPNPTIQTSLAGTGTKEAIEMTKEQQEAKQNAINKEIEGVFINTGSVNNPDNIFNLMKALNQLSSKVDHSKITTLVNALNNKPSLVDQALTFIS